MQNIIKLLDVMEYRLKAAHFLKKQNKNHKYNGPWLQHTTNRMDVGKIGKVFAYNNKVHEFVMDGFKLL